MKPEIHAAWIADLRSGKHEQVKETLCDGTGFCCLGRLTELYREAEPGEMEFSVGNLEYWWTNGAEQSHLPAPVMKWADFGSSVGNIGVWEIPPNEEDDEADSLASLNDSGLTFPQIADVIEYLGADYF